MNITEINAKTAEMLAAVTAKPGIIIRHFPRFEGDLVEIRNADNSLRWRSYAFEADFLFNLARELERDAAPKTSEAVAAEAASKRETQLRLEAMFFEQKGMDDFEIFTSDEFTREEVEAEILKMKCEQLNLQQSYAMKTFSITFCNTKSSNPAPILKAFKSEADLHVWAVAYCDSHNAFCGYTFKALPDNSERLETARVRINLAYGAIQAGATLQHAIESVAGTFEEDGGISPFDCEGFASAFSTAMQSDQQTVDALISALSVDVYGFSFDNRQMKVTTVAGMTLIAPVWRVQLKNGPIAQMWAWWDMRHGLIRNVSYLALVSEGNVSNIEYV